MRTLEDFLADNNVTINTEFTLAQIKDMIERENKTRALNYKDALDGFIELINEKFFLQPKVAFDLGLKEKEMREPIYTIGFSLNLGQFSLKLEGLNCTKTIKPNALVEKRKLIAEAKGIYGGAVDWPNVPTFPNEFKQTLEETNIPKYGRLADIAKWVKGSPTSWDENLDTCKQDGIVEAMRFKLLGTVDFIKVEYDFFEEALVVTTQGRNRTLPEETLLLRPGHICGYSQTFLTHWETKNQSTVKSRATTIAAQYQYLSNKGMSNLIRNASFEISSLVEDIPQTLNDITEALYTLKVEAKRDDFDFSKHQHLIAYLSALKS